MRIKIAKELPTDPENCPKVGGVEVGVLGGEYEPAAETEEVAAK